MARPTYSPPGDEVDPAAVEAAGVEASPALLEPPRDAPSSRPPRPWHATLASAGGVDTPTAWLSADYFARQIGRLSMRSRSEEVDDFGLDPRYEAEWLPWLELLYRRWFRVVTVGMDRVPSRGAAILVANHGGVLPLDGLMLKMAVRLEQPGHRELRWLAEDYVAHTPFVGPMLHRLGAVRACPENAERLLAQEKLVAVFPEGSKGTEKAFRDRYRLQRFGRGGYVKLALRTGAPILPVAILGAEETHPLLGRLSRLPALAGLPPIPVTPTFPWLGPLGLVPLPAQWRIHVGDPIELGALGPEAERNDVLVHRANDRVRSAVQELLLAAQRARRSVFRG